ncbi:fumarate hydratase [Pseudomonas aeruginosa]
MVPGDKVEVDVAAKGGGSEKASRRWLSATWPTRSCDWVLLKTDRHGRRLVPRRAYRHRGIGGAEKAAVMAEEASRRTRSTSTTAMARGPDPSRLRLELFEKVNQLGIGALRAWAAWTTVLARQDHGLPDPRRLLAAGVHDPQLRRGHHARWRSTAPAPPTWKRRRSTPTRRSIWEAGPSARARRPGQDHPGREVQSDRARPCANNGKMATPAATLAHKVMRTGSRQLPVD